MDCEQLQGIYHTSAQKCCIRTNPLSGHWKVAMETAALGPLSHFSFENPKDPSKPDQGCPKTALGWNKTSWPFPED